VKVLYNNSYKRKMMVTLLLIFNVDNTHNSICQSIAAKYNLL